MHLDFAEYSRVCAAKSASLDFMQLKLTSDFFLPFTGPPLFSIHHLLHMAGGKIKNNKELLS